MEIFTYERLARRRARFGKYASIIGLLILAGGLVASFYSQYLYLSFAALIVGFILSQIGNYNLLRWGRKPRADMVLNEGLKGLERKWRIYHYYLPAAHVLIGPGGLYVFVVKPQTGKIRCEGKRWKHKLTLGRALLFFGDESLGNPPADLDFEMRQLARFVNEKRPDLNTVLVHGAVVFSNEKAELELNNPTIKVLRPKQLKGYVRVPAGEGEKYLDPEQRRALSELFDQEVARLNGSAA